MQIADILRQVRGERPGAGPIAPAARLEALRDRLGELAAELGLVGLNPQELSLAVAAAPEDHEEVMLALRRLMAVRPELGARADTSAEVLQGLADLGAALSQAEGAFRAVKERAQLGTALLLADLTERIDQVDEAFEAERAEAAPPERLRLEVIFQSQEALRLRGRRAQEGRRARAEVRAALLESRLDAERRRAQALRTAWRLREAALPPPRTERDPAEQPGGRS
ncbi:MAG: hypothetical protein RMK29_19810 [Myxococcales bacterium]|nr:hypothetical protein [Myxococcota bacterium]MDW8283955.1 hypothetical protein [Myxococcales bacterium]